MINGIRFVFFSFGVDYFVYSTLCSMYVMPYDTSITLSTISQKCYNNTMQKKKSVKLIKDLRHIRSGSKSISKMLNMKFYYQCKTWLLKCGENKNVKLDKLDKQNNNFNVEKSDV